MEKLVEQSNLRKYILGDISDEDRSAIEERLLTDDEFFEELSMTEENLIQDYVDENLDSTERERFEKCFLNSEENRQKVKFAHALRKYVNETDKVAQPQTKPNFFSSLIAFFSAPVPIALTVLAIAAIAGFFVWKSSNNRSEVLVALNKAYKNDRPTEARITGFDYAPKIEGTRGNNKEDNLDLVFAKARATEAVLKNETAENLHELGRVLLAEKNFDAAIKYFEKALKKNSNIAKLRNDLGVALMEKAKLQTEGKLENLAKANEEFAKAIELDRNLLDAYFNQALCIQELNLPNQAKEAWQKYLELDSSSQWAEEARKNLQTIETQKPISKTKEEILQDFLQAKQTGDHEKAWQTLSRNRGMVTGKLIPQQLAFLFVDAKTNAGEAKKYLEALIYIGKLEEEKSGDLFWKEIAEFYSVASNEEIFVLKQAQDAVREGYQLLLVQEYGKSLDKFSSAKFSFSNLKNITEEKICDHWIAFNLFQQSRLKESNKIFKDIASLGESRHYKWLASQAHIRLAYNKISENDYTTAIEHGEKVLEYVEKTEDFFSQNTALTIIAYSYKDLGRYELALKFSEKSLKMQQFFEASQNQKWTDYLSITEAFQGLKFYNSALFFQKEALKISQDLNDKYNEQVSNIFLAHLYMLKKKYEDAEVYIQESIRIARVFSDEGVRQKSLAHAQIQYGSLKRLEEKYQEAIDILNEAGTFHDNSEFQLFRYSLHIEKLLSYLKIKNDSEIQSELQIILDIFRTHRIKILEEQNRNYFFDNKQSIYDIAADYEFGKGNYVEAFNHLEESRSRSLLDLQNSVIEVSTREKKPEIRFSSNVFEPLTLSQIQTEMPKNVQLLEYAVLEDKVLIWLITNNGLSVAKYEISSETLQEKILTYLDLVSRNIEPNEQRRLATELYQILISPIKDKLEPDKEICLIPDKVLFRLPFATLFAEKYFIEEYKLFYAPSANVFLICSKKAKEMETKTSEILLSIGNPTFNQNAFANLQSLPSARKESQQITAYYDNSTVFTEKNATKENIRTNLAKADIVHFAGHYVIDEHSPLSSSLILAGNDKDEASLANYEIIGEKLSHLRLMVLSACQTQVEKYYNGEGMIGASRTFLATGVPLVVASQWEVDSEATAQLMTDFHRRRKTEKLSTVEALRQSQLEMLKNEKYQQPYYWAAFITLGGYAKF